MIIYLDTKTVTEKFEDISARYYQFGTYLKIKPGKLDGIKNETSIHDLMQGVILEFLRSRREKYKPTWRTIVDAVFDIHPALAQEIAKQHLGGFMHTYTRILYMYIQWNSSKRDHTMHNWDHIIFVTCNKGDINLGLTF